MTTYTCKYCQGNHRHSSCPNMRNAQGQFVPNHPSVARNQGRKSLAERFDSLGIPRTKLDFCLGCKTYFHKDEEHWCA